MGCYNSPPLESDFALEVILRKQLRILLAHLGLGFLRPLRAFPVLPLNFNQVHYLIPQGLHLLIQNFHRLLNVVQAIIDLDVFQWDHNFLVSYTLSPLGNMDGIMDLTQLLR